MQQCDAQPSQYVACLLTELQSASMKAKVMRKCDDNRSLMNTDPTRMCVMGAPGLGPHQVTCVSYRGSNLQDQPVISAAALHQQQKDPLTWSTTVVDREVVLLLLFPPDAKF